MSNLKYYCFGGAVRTECNGLAGLGLSEGKADAI